MDVTPANSRERSFTIVVILIALVVFCSLPKGPLMGPRQPLAPRKLLLAPKMALMALEPLFYYH